MKDQEIQNKVVDALDASVERLDAETRQKLFAAREHALSKHKPFIFQHWGKAILATSFSLVMAVAIFYTQFRSPMQNEPIEALELIASQDTLEMYEDLEFYAWLVEEDATS